MFSKKGFKVLCRTIVRILLVFQLCAECVSTFKLQLYTCITIDFFVPNIQKRSIVDKNTIYLVCSQHSRFAKIRDENERSPFGTIWSVSNLLLLALFRWAIWRMGSNIVQEIGPTCAPKVGTVNHQTRIISALISHLKKAWTWTRNVIASQLEACRSLWDCESVTGVVFVRRLAYPHGALRQHHFVFFRAKKKSLNLITIMLA